MIFLDATKEGWSLRSGLMKWEMLEDLVILALHTGGYDMLTPELPLEAFNSLLRSCHSNFPCNASHTRLRL